MALSTERQIKETMLVQIIPNLGKTHMSIALKYYVNNIMSCDTMCKVLKNKVLEVEEANIKF